ncbi:MAG: hypothetical protein AAGF85_06780 [Bacteroidota bacterium]
MRALSILLVSFCAVACSKKSELGWSEYRAWLGDQENGIVKSKKNRYIRLTSRFQPIDYLAFKDVDFSSADVKGTRDNYKGTINFQFEVNAEDVDTNLLWLGLADYAGYKQRVNQLSFHSQKFFKMKLGNEKLAPQFVHFEGYNELSKRLLFHVTFEYPLWDQLDPETKLRFTFEDPYWGSGVNHFTYRKKNLTDIPKLIIG